MTQNLIQEESLIPVDLKTNINKVISDITYNKPEKTQNGDQLILESGFCSMSMNGMLAQRRTTLCIKLLQVDFF